MEDPPVTPQTCELAGLTWREQVRRIHTEAQTFYFAFKHPAVPWYAKLVAACTAGYLFSPIQLIPSFIPVIGLLDDVLILLLGVRLLQRMIPVDILSECREQAKSAEMQRKDAGTSTAAVIAFLAIAMLWLFAAISVSKLIATYIPSDCVIQNGTRHAWHNRSSQRCVVAFSLVGAQRERTS